LRWQRMERYGSLQAPGGEAGTPHFEPIPQEPGLRPPVAYDAFQQPTPYDGHPQSPPPNGLPQPAPHETPPPY
ncbi:hypothetical protein ABZ468_47835, partial [Streptomyces sp. NPDC005708]